MQSNYLCKMKSSHPSGIGLEKNLMKQLEIRIVGSGETTKEGNQSLGNQAVMDPVACTVLQRVGLQGKGRSTI